MNILVNTTFALKREKFYPFANQSHYIYVHSSNCKLQLISCSLPFLPVSAVLSTESLPT